MGVLCAWFNPSVPLRLASPRRFRPLLSPPFPAPPPGAAGAPADAIGVAGSAVCSAHSNPRILKSTRDAPYRRHNTSSHEGRRDEDKEEEDEDEEEQDEDSECSSDDEYSDLEFVGGRHSNVRKSSVYSKEQPNGKSVHQIGLNDQVEWSTMKGRPKAAYGSKDGNYDRSRSSGRFTDVLNESSRMDVVGGEELDDEKFSRSKFSKLKDELDFDVRWFPLIEYLSTYGLKESHFISMYERHMPCLQINVASAKERLDYLMSVGVKHRDIRKILLRQPQLLEYTVENNLKVHVSFLASLGIPDSRIGQIITAAPSLFSYSIEDSLKPTVRYLVEEVGISRTDVSKVVQLSPQILVQRIDNSWNLRLSFLSKELGAPRDSIVKMVRKHPQLLHYSIEDGMQPRINFLRSIGMRNSEILKVLTSLTQVLSLSLEDNLKPKYLYLVNELRNEVKSLTKYPMYLSLSLEQRIRPRHRFLVSLKKVPKGPFPLSSLVPKDECFCQQWAGTSLEKYLAFKQSLQLNNFAKKYERK